MRGEGEDCLVDEQGTGITPAHAGRRTTSSPSAPFSRDHPRACGEKSFYKSKIESLRGSPPRMRGEDRKTMIFLSLVRITPAHAGRRTWRMEKGVATWDHPRACGEKDQKHHLHYSRRGSPPRMRGEVACGFLVSCFSGITPAHAGRSVRIMPLKTRQRDHPRACGEKCSGCGCRAGYLGSPPRMRGEVFRI